MTSTSNDARRDGIVARLTAARAGLERCVADVTPEVGGSGSEWSVGDLLVHLNEPYYHNMARQFLINDKPQFGGYEPQGGWQRGVEQALDRVDEAISIAGSLTPEQMSRVGQRMGQPFTALDALELCAGHFEEHLAQLRDEIRPRENLPSVSA